MILERNVVVGCDCQLNGDGHGVPSSSVDSAIPFAIPPAPRYVRAMRRGRPNPGVRVRNART